jgi:Peptidase family S41
MRLKNNIPLLSFEVELRDPYKKMKKTQRSLLFLAILAVFFCTSCSDKLYTPLKKYSPTQLQEDFDLMRTVMEKFHPSLYWYTPKDSMDIIFNHFRGSIRDSMNEQQFGFSILAPVTTSIHCGHTSFNYSKKYNKFMQGIRLPSFPLFLKIWGDTMIVTGNLNRKDSIIKRGTQINSIDGRNAAELTHIMFRFLPIDGYADNMNYLRLSSAFPYYHRNIFGISKSYSVDYTDSTGNGIASIPLFEPLSDTTKRDRKDLPNEKRKKPGRNETQKDGRSLKFDSAHNAAIMTVNSFDEGYHLPKFFRQSFRTIRKKNITNLVIDIRNNGGGKVNHYTRLAAYLRNTPFKVADTAVSIRKGFGSYGKYFTNSKLNSIALGLFTSKKSDARYHFNYWENHVFKPKKKNFFQGNVYVLINGSTFSASTLFAHALKGQENVQLLGEEAGGGNYGNNGLMIPNIVLPNTGMRVRMPLFRLVQYNHGIKDGRGVMPDIYIPPTADAVRKLTDRKMKIALEMMNSPH